MNGHIDIIGFLAEFNFIKYTPATLRLPPLFLTCGNRINKFVLA